MFNLNLFERNKEHSPLLFLHSNVFFWSHLSELHLMYWNLLTIKNNSACCRKLDAKDLILDRLEVLKTSFLLVTNQKFMLRTELKGT